MTAPDLSPCFESLRAHGARSSRQLLALPPGPQHETWIGDDAAVLRGPAGPLLLAADTSVEGVHIDPSTQTVEDLGWLAVTRNMSDIAAMGGEPLHLVVTVVVPPGRGGDLEPLYDGILAATAHHGGAVVGGDLTGGPALVVTVAITGTVLDGEPVLRSGARPGDAVFVTGPLGGAAAGLRTGHPARPLARVAEGTGARRAGATAMIDVSDGLALDLRRLAAASRVGIDIDPDAVPVADGAMRDEALTGGEDYELVFTASDVARVRRELAGLREPVEIGRVTDGDGVTGLPEGGWRHSW
jgi:thiamine-monophosphate kinase